MGINAACSRLGTVLTSPSLLCKHTWTGCLSLLNALSAEAISWLNGEKKEETKGARRDFWLEVAGKGHEIQLAALTTSRTLFAKSFLLSSCKAFSITGTSSPTYLLDFPRQHMTQRSLERASFLGMLPASEVGVNCLVTRYIQCCLGL